MSLKAICDKLSTGSFEDVVKDIEVLCIGSNFKHAVFVIRKVCESVLKISNLSQTQIQSTLNVCCVCLQCITQNKAGDVIPVDQKLTASLFHIARIIGKDDIKAFLELICASLPVFESMPNAEDPKQFNTIVQFGILISNYFAKLEEQLSQSNPAHIELQFLEYWEMMLRVSDLSRKELIVVFNMALKIVGLYSSKVKAAKQVEELADKIFLGLKNFLCKIVMDQQDPDLNKVFYQCLKAALRTLRSLSSRDQYKLAFKVWNDLISSLKVVLPNSSIEYKALCVIDDCLSPLLSSPKTIPLSTIPFKELRETLVVLKRATGGSEAVGQAAFVISSMLTLLTTYWCKNFEKVESEFPRILISNLEGFFTELLMILKSSCCFVCATGFTSCGLNGDIFYAFQVELALLFFCAWLINWDATSRPWLLKVCESSFLQCEELLSMGKGRSCFKSSDFTIHLCDRAYAVAVHNKDNPQVCKEILVKSRDWYIQLNKEKGCILPLPPTAVKILKILAMAYRDLGETISALETAAVALALEGLSPEQSQDMTSLKLWSELVAQVPNEYMSLVTFVKTNKLVKDFLGDNSYDDARLFILEMTAFGSCKPQKFSVLRCSWKSRKGLNLSPLQKIQTAALFLGALALCEDFEMVREFISSFKTEDYHELLKSMPSEDRPLALCALAELFYCRFFVEKKIHQASSKKRVEEAKTFKPLPKIVLSTTDVVDKNDVCNLTPTFEDLSISKELSLLNNLDKALKYWDDSLKTGLKASHLSNRELLRCADNLIVAALTFRLSGHYLKEKNAWELCRSFGQQVRNDQLVLRAISGLMDVSCCDAGSVQLSQSIAATFANEPTAAHVLHIYKNSYVVYCFSNNKAEEGAAILKELLKFENKWAWFYIKSMFLYARILFETSRSLRLSLFPEEHDDMLTIVRDCYSKLVALTESLASDEKSWSNETEQTSVLDLFSSISLWLGYTYLEMMLPRESRCFLKLLLLVTQKAGLAVRTAECLSLLGKVDLLVQRIEDGLVKVEGLKQILEVESSLKEDMADEIPVYQDEEDVNRLRLAPKIGNQTGASPVLPISRFSMPEFSSHKTSCCCYHCCHILLHTLWLDVGYIEATALSTQCQVRRAKLFFHDAIKLADVFRKKHEKLLNGFFNGPAMLDYFIRSETTLRLKFGDLLILEGKDDKQSVNQAWDINERLSSSLAKAQSKDTLLLSDVGEQRITLIDIRNQQSWAQVLKQQPLKVDTTAAPVTPNLKTPLASTLPGEKARTPLEAIAPQNVIPVKGKAFIQARGALPLVFHLSDSDDEAAVGSKQKAKGTEDKKKEREKKTKASARSIKEKETKKDLKSAQSSRSAAVDVTIDSDTVIPDSDDDCQLVSPYVKACLSGSQTSKRVNEAQSKVKNIDDDSDNDVKVLSRTRTVKSTRSKAGTTVTEKAKSHRTVTTVPSEKRGSSSVPVKYRSRRLL